MGWMNPMEWIGGPQAWFGVLGLTMIEILVGLANVVFIVILANEFPAAQRNGARLFGLGLMLLMRLWPLAQGLDWPEPVLVSDRMSTPDGIWC